MVMVVRILLVAVNMGCENGGVGIDTGDGPATGRGH